MCEALTGQNPRVTATGGQLTRPQVTSTHRPGTQNAVPLPPQPSSALADPTRSVTKRFLLLLPENRKAFQLTVPTFTPGIQFSKKKKKKIQNYNTKASGMQPRYTGLFYR